MTKPPCFAGLTAEPLLCICAKAHDLTVDWCWLNLANTWICLVLDWANTRLHSAAPRTTGCAHSQFNKVQLFGHHESGRPGHQMASVVLSLAEALAGYRRVS
jgi:hypothetical protein